MMPVTVRERSASVAVRRNTSAGRSEQCAGALVAELARRALGRAGAGHDAEVAVRVADLRVGGGYDEVACQQEFEAARAGQAVDRGDAGERACLQPV